MRNAIVIVSLLFTGCWADWPPSPDGGTDWYPPARCGGEPCPAPSPPTPYDAGVIDVGPLELDADTPDEDAGSEADEDAGSGS